ncbi:hypothetical protein [Dactylosporangium sp. CS-033363]|uniref:hypothetical protein n=1 Tax=Dactylosporangium sp. CS-033363 TaxID=3239935 RepID=UPI003D8AAC98
MSGRGPARARYVAVAIALAAAAVLLVRPAPGNDPPPVVVTVDVAATLPDGTTFSPAAVLDPHHVVVQIADPDPAYAVLALLDPADPADPRRLDRIPIAGGGSFDAVRVAGGFVYWMSSVGDGQGATRSTLRRAGRDGTPQVLTTETGRALFTGGMHDLEIAEGRIWWTATRGLTEPTTDLRSVPLAGGDVAVRALDGTYHLTDWPWATDDGIAGRPVTQRNLVTGERRTFAESPGRDVSCGAVWCRSVAHTEQGAVVTLRRTDGTGETGRINGDGEVPLFLDIAAMGRYEILAAPISARAATATERLAMVDLTTGRRTALAVASGAGLSGSWLWWATGDRETMTWHLLDLASLS